MAEIEMRAGDVDTAIAVMREVAQWCIQVGKNMWSLQELTRDMLLRHPRTESSFVTAWSDGQPAASMILQWHDPQFWPRVQENESGFIHKLCVRRSFAGTGLSTRMVGYAAGECRRRGAGYLRLDTDATKPRLCALYEGLGFKRAGRKLLDGRDYALYELQI